MYQVKLQKFEGPLDLLLELIQKEKLQINEISLAQIASQFLEYLKNETEIEPRHLADFLFVAAKLILIKSRSLLPLLTLTDDEEEEIKDLTERLKEYKKFKDISSELQKILRKNIIAIAREPYFNDKISFYPPKYIKKELLFSTFKKIVDSFITPESPLEKRIKKVISLEKRIVELKERIEKNLEETFNSLLSSKKSKIEIIITFLAILELTKQKFLIVRQESIFGEISLEKIK